MCRFREVGPAKKFADWCRMPLSRSGFAKWDFTQAVIGTVPDVYCKRNLIFLSKTARQEWIARVSHDGVEFEKRATLSCFDVRSASTLRYRTFRHHNKSVNLIYSKALEKSIDQVQIFCSFLWPTLIFLVLFKFAFYPIIASTIFNFWYWKLRRWFWYHSIDLEKVFGIFDFHLNSLPLLSFDFLKTSTTILARWIPGALCFWLWEDKEPYSSGNLRFVCSLEVGPWTL